MFPIVQVANDVPPLSVSMGVLHKLAEIYSHVPTELCGYLAGELGDGFANTVVFLTNTSPTPEMAYQVSDDDVMRYAQAVEDESLHTYAGFHSHVQHGPYPSRVDVQYAPPGLAYQVIVGVGPSFAAYVGDFSLPAAIRIVDTHVHCIRCGGIEHLDHYVPVDTIHFCTREQS